MPHQIANPIVVEEVALLARQTGRIPALLVQVDQIPDRSDAFDPLAWDELGLPA